MSFVMLIVVFLTLVLWDDLVLASVSTWHPRLSLSLVRVDGVSEVADWLSSLLRNHY